MEDANSITFRLESYLLQLSDVNHRWGDWLSRNELAIFEMNAGELKALEAQAQGLMQELTAIAANRQQLLDDAALVGMPAGNLQTLARSLPAWNRPTLRGAIAKAMQQLSNLRRLHVATWVLTSQRLQLFRDSMAILMVGTAKRDVYTNTPNSESGGGQLLDASL